MVHGAYQRLSPTRSVLHIFRKSVYNTEVLVKDFERIYFHFFDNLNCKIYYVIEYLIYHVIEFNKSSGIDS